MRRTIYRLKMAAQAQSPEMADRAVTFHVDGTFKRIQGRKRTAAGYGACSCFYHDGKNDDPGPFKCQVCRHLFFCWQTVLDFPDMGLQQTPCQIPRLRWLNARPGM
ncbi:hypothetical protein GCM10027419_51390 [Pandoraea terrae]